MKAIADTGFLVAFGNRNDQHHAWALEIAKRITEPLLTCDAVLAEALNRTSRRTKGKALARRAFDFRTT